MQIKLIAIGKKMPSWVQTGIHHYQKQLPSSLNFELITPEAQQRKHNDINKIKNAEGDLLINAAKGASLIIALDENGKQHTTHSMAQQMKNWQESAQSVALLIGGADGLSDNVKEQAHQQWGLSRLTLPHAMARVLILEQIYRAHSLLNNHPYHRQ